jgi:DNA-binding NtrC family response regulator
MTGRATSGSLENAVFRAAVLSDGDMLTEDEFPQIRAQVEGFSLRPMREPPVRKKIAPRSKRLGADHAGNRINAGRVPTVRRRLAGRHFGIVWALDDRGNVRTLADIELEMIKLAIDHYQGQMSEVARRLGIGRSTLYRKLKEYGRVDGSAPQPIISFYKCGLPALAPRFFVGMPPWCYRISPSKSGG